MGVSVLVIGHSGAGKSTSLRNFEPGEIGIFNVVGKPLPFRKKLQKLDHCQYNQIHMGLTKNKLRAYVIDDANYLMAFQNFRLAKQSDLKQPTPRTMTRLFISSCIQIMTKQGA